MKRVTKVFATLIATVGIIAIATHAKAYSAKASLTSTSNLQAGETLQVSFNIIDIEAGAGIDALKGQLVYDSNVLEPIIQDDINGKNSWGISMFKEDTYGFSLTRGSKFTAGGTVLNLTFKVKPNITVTSTKISINDISVSGGSVANGGTGDILVGNASVTISAIEPPQSSTEEPTPTPDPTPAPTTPSTTQQNTAKDTTVTNTKQLPKAGISMYGIIAVFVVVIIAALSYVLYKKTAKEVK